ncbi:hypothetical protein KFU94_53480 [Chloroflexi bacterium TSY]|nr:hypothetical protein [Chloroflexi bacterium TSY]
MQRVSQQILNDLKEFDTATIFNAMVRHGGLPNLEYTSHEIRCLLPELGRVVGYAVTGEVTTNDADSDAVDWMDYYEYLDQSAGPLITVLKDVDSDPGRGACFGDGMATVHKRLGVVGVIVGGTARDLAGIREVGIPVFGWGAVPGHGVFNMTRFNTPVTIGQLRIRPGDLIVADADGCVRVPNESAEEILRLAGEVRKDEADVMAFYRSPEFSLAEMRRRRKG